MRIRRIAPLLAALAVLLLGLCACRTEGNPLPAGMEEEALLSKGREMVRALAGNDWDAAWGLLRRDVAETTSPEAIEEVVLSELEGAGVYRQIDSTLTTGQSSNGEDYGVCVFYCEYSKKKVLMRIAVDPDMEIIGFEVKRR